MKINKLAIVGLYALILISCTGKISSSAHPTDGTSDAGGGNGIDNKAYEAYIVHPDQLPAYKQLIEPKIQKLAVLSSEPNTVVDIMNKWALYKTWYVAPVKLDTISKDVLGMSFSSDRTEQLAIQTKKEIWINSDGFNLMSMQDQAALIIHEMTMSLYFLKYKSWQEVCSESIYPNMSCNSRDMDVMNELYPSTTPQPLNSSDYNNIRTVTGYFLGKSAYQSTQEIDNILINNQFDARFTFKLGLDSNNVKQNIIYKTETISPSLLSQVLTTAVILNQSPDVCKSLKFNQSFDCSTISQQVPLQTKIGTTPSTLISVSSSSLQPAFAFNLSKATSDTSASSAEYIMQHKKLLYIALMPQNYFTPWAIGTSFRSGVLVAEQDTDQVNPQYKLLGLISVPGVVVTDKNSTDNDCAYAKPSPTSLYNDTVIVFSKNLSDFEKRLLQAGASLMPPATTCISF